MPGRFAELLKRNLCLRLIALPADEIVIRDKAVRDPVGSGGPEVERAVRVLAGGAGAGNGVPLLSRRRGKNKNEAAEDLGC